MANAPGYPDWDIIGGPGVKPTKPVQADFEPGGKWYGLMAWSIAQKHYERALEASRYGFWYHGNFTKFTPQQVKHNNSYAKAGGESDYGIPTGDPKAAGQRVPDYRYEFVNGEWKQISTKPGGESDGGVRQPDPMLSPDATGSGSATPTAEWLDNWYTSGDRFNDQQAPIKAPSIPSTPPSGGGGSTPPSGNPAPPTTQPEPETDWNGIPLSRSTRGGNQDSSLLMRGGNKENKGPQAELYTGGFGGGKDGKGGKGPKAPSWWNDSWGSYQGYMNQAEHYQQNPWTPPGSSTGGGGTGGGPGGGDAPGGGMGANQGAFDAMVSLLNQYGLGSLAGVLQGLILDGVTDQASLMLALQNTDEWKTRFAGNEMLRNAGLGVLSPAEYLAVERSYAQILKNSGLPSGFYDDPADFAKWIGNNVSANELQQRAQMFSDIAKREDPAIVEQLKSMGMSAGDILAYTMDPSRAMPLLQKKYQTTLIGAAARRQGVVGDNEYLGHLSDIGVTEQQAIQGYGVIGENLGTLDKLGDIHGEGYEQRDFESEVFEQDGKSAKKRKRLASRERATFSGESGVGQGSLTRPTGGSY